jgi:hypothetical protein
LAREKRPSSIFSIL